METRMINDLNKPSNDSDPHKQPYHTPELVTYGDVREITKNAGGMTGMNDGGGGPDKTSP